MAAIAARRHSGNMGDSAPKKEKMKYKSSGRFNEGNLLNLFIDGGMEKKIRKLRAAIKCEINNFMHFGKGKVEYINTKQTFCRTCSPEKRKAKWNACSHDKVGLATSDDFNTNDNIDKATLVHFDLHGFKLPIDIENYEIDMTLGYVVARNPSRVPTLDTIKKKIQAIMNAPPMVRTTDHGGRRRRRRKSRKKRRKSRKKRRKSRKKRRKSRRRRR